MKKVAYDTAMSVMPSRGLPAATAAREVRWGCIGTGQIAIAMAQQLSRLPDARLEAICSASGRSLQSARGAAAKCGFARALSLEALVTDSAIDVVYVASANTAHAKHSLAALRGGKAVLCEKPLTMSVGEAEEVFAASVSARRLLVDGTFSACLPAFAVIRAQLPELGRITHVELHKKIRPSILRSSPIINRRALGGGLFDGCGSYTAHCLCVLFGAAAVAALRPQDVEVASVAGGPGDEVDYDTTATVRICGCSAFLTHRAAEAARRSIVRGERGCMEFELPRLQYVVLNGERIDTAYGGGAPFADLPSGEAGAPHGVHPGLGVQAAAFQRALHGADGPGTVELPLDVMRAMAHVMNLIRHRIPTHIHYRWRPKSRI